MIYDITLFQCSDKLGLSLELGSFAAGVMISTTDLAQHTLEQVCFFLLIAFSRLSRFCHCFISAQHFSSRPLLERPFLLCDWVDWGNRLFIGLAWRKNSKNMLNGFEFIW